MRRVFCSLFIAILSFLTLPIFAATSLHVPILTYHNFNPTVPGIMSITPAKFEYQMKWLKDNGYTFIPLKDLVAYLKGEKVTLPKKPIVITADDGWGSVYHYMLPIAEKYQIPVTLFIYPSVVSRHIHVLTWDQLKELQNTGLFDIECHTYWHPNFHDEKKTQSPEAYKRLVHVQLYRSREILENKLGKKITLLAWPYGAYDNDLRLEAAKAGYTMSFSIDGRRTSLSENIMSEPRYMVAEKNDMNRFAKMTRE